MESKLQKLATGLLLIILVTVYSALKAESADAEKYFLNPIMAGDYPDPSILRDGDDYYLTHSSFEYYPGLLIWHSKDLVNWKPLVHALHRNVGSVWAPDLIKYKDTFYIYFPASGKNWVVTATDPAGPWSDPVVIDIGHIDPGHIADQEGNRYLYLSSGYAIRLDQDGLSAAGDLFHAYDGWDIPVNWDVACFCLEGPKLIFRKGYYYLTCAEGGTVGPATAHMAVSARARNATGPWENSPYNPIVHTWSENETWHAKGHGTVFEDKDGNWWIVHHGYKRNFYSLGRQTLMEPVEWTEDGWFVVPDDIKTDQPIPVPHGVGQTTRLDLSDDFSGERLNMQWHLFRDYEPSRIRLVNNTLSFEARGSSPSDSAPLLCIPANESYEIQVNYTLHGETKGGLILFYNENQYAGLVTDGDGFTIYRRGQSLDHGKNELGRTGFLKILNEKQKLTFFYSVDGMKWQKIQRSFMVDGYNHTNFGDFISLRTGLVSMGNGRVDFQDFVYRELD